MNVPPVWRAYSQLNSADRAFPMWRKPVGAGEKRTRTVMMRLQRRALHHTTTSSTAPGPAPAPGPTSHQWYGRRRARSGLNREQLPLLGDALQLERAARLEGQAGAGDAVAPRPAPHH